MVILQWILHYRQDSGFPGNELGRSGEGDAAPLAPHGISIAALGRLGHGPRRGLESQAESGTQEVRRRVSAASQSRFVRQPLSREHRLHRGCSTLRSRCRQSQNLGGHQGHVTQGNVTQGHIQAGCAKLPKGSGCPVSIKASSVVSEKVCLSEEEAFCTGKVLAEIFEQE